MKRTTLLLLSVIAMVSGTIGSVLATIALPRTADACSIAPPSVAVAPSTDLVPGQKLSIAGYNFVDLIWHDAAPVDPERPDEPAIASCNFDTIAMTDIPIIWHGSTVEKLAVVNGPDFTSSVKVPASATPGKVRITVGKYDVVVQVRHDVPSPCDGFIKRADCPPPGPCDYPQAEAEVGLATGCPPVEPCLYPADAALPGQWCPPVEPCLYSADAALPGHWCPPVEPCPVSPTATSPVWCPPEPPCVYPAESTRPAIDVWCPPEPCEVYVHDAPDCPPPCVYPAESTRPAIDVWCPPEPPCEIIGGDAVWCPEPCLAVGAPVADRCPQPCEIIGGDAVWCPEPQPSVTAPSVQPVEEPAGEAPPAQTTAPAPQGRPSADAASEAITSVTVDPATTPEGVDTPPRAIEQPAPAPASAPVGETSPTIVEEPQSQPAITPPSTMSHVVATDEQVVADAVAVRAVKTVVITISDLIRALFGGVAVR